ncbi:hypothetical protein [Marinoscillum sp. MHG1-6]|uniref:hypothetical protein n=1 Tax=Marinoscillum sp. MHG1-6 TaxID=2959627 RepID=UPI0021570D3D|nr:hypothetical protein [Marinoscillum sp. MHG1-6]
MLDYEKKKQLSILVNIAMVDEEFADSERAAIMKIGRNYGASDEEIHSIFNSHDFQDSLAPMTVIDKMEFIMDCMLVILADNVVTKAEEAFALGMAKKLGFRKETIGFLIENKDIGRSEMKELLIPYMVH